MNSDFWKSAVNKWISVISSEDETRMKQFIDILGGTKTQEVKKKIGTIMDTLLDDEEDDA